MKYKSSSKTWLRRWSGFPTPPRRLPGINNQEAVMKNDTKLSRNKLDAMIHNIGYPDLVLNDTQLHTEIKGVSKLQILD